MESLLEEFRYRRADGGHRRCEGRGRHLRARGIAAVGKAALGDRALDRHVAAAKVTSGERVTAHEEEVENENRQPEMIVVSGAPCGTKRSSEQFRRDEQLGADEARKAGPITDLKTVAVDGGDGCGLADENVRVVDVA